MVSISPRRGGACPGTCLWRDGSGPRGAVDWAEVDDVPLATPGDQRKDPEGAVFACDRSIAHPRPVDPPVGPLVVLLPGCDPRGGTIRHLSLIHISEPTRPY